MLCVRSGFLFLHPGRLGLGMACTTGACNFTLILLFPPLSFSLFLSLGLRFPATRNVLFERQPTQMVSGLNLELFEDVLFCFKKRFVLVHARTFCAICVCLQWYKSPSERRAGTRRYSGSIAWKQCKWAESQRHAARCSS